MIPNPKNDIEYTKKCNPMTKNDQNHGLGIKIIHIAKR